MNSEFANLIMYGKQKISGFSQVDKQGGQCTPAKEMRLQRINIPKFFSPHELKELRSG